MSEKLTRELLVIAARDAGFNNRQLCSMFYESGPYDVTFPTQTLKRFIELILQRAADASPHQASVLAWAIDSFGPIAKNRDERAARLVEEAIEIAQVEGVPLDVVKRIADRTYSRPAGELWQELGGLAITMLAFAENVGLSASECARREWDRVCSKPKEWWRKKHAEKVAAGTADLSPTDASPLPDVSYPDSCFQPEK